MAELKEYVVLVNDLPHTMLLSEEDAKARGGVETKEASAPVNKARGVSNKSVK